MSIKACYNRILHNAESAPQTIEKMKTACAEDYAIIHKAPIYNSIKWTPEQQRAFDNYWMDVYGKTIPNKWHRLYEAISGQYCVNYIPEKIYTTVIEPSLNDYTYAKVLQDKSLVESLSAGSDCVVPETVLVCSGGYLFTSERKPINVKEALTSVKTSGKVVIKPTINSSSGKQIVFFEFSSETDQEIENSLKKMGNDFIVQKEIVPHPDFSVFNPTSINTIRIITFLVNGSIHHAPLSFRIGRIKSKVDNIHAGGLGIGLDDQGYLLPKAYELGYGDNSTTYTEHPDSRTVFAGRKLPAIDKVINAAYTVHGRYPHIGIISWDFTVDKDGNAVLIEANIKGQGVWLPQIIHGKGLFGEYTKEVLSKVRKSE